MKIKGFPSKPKEVMPPPDIEHVHLSGKIYREDVEKKHRKNQVHDKGKNKNCRVAGKIQ